MTRARTELVSLADTPYYHCVCRCVRRAFLWGNDRFSGKDYSHRKQWAVERLAVLSKVFAIDLCAYAVMSNHYHVVVRIDEDRAKKLTEKEVIERWGTLFGVPVLVSRYRRGETTTEAEQNQAREIIESDYQQKQVFVVPQLNIGNGFTDYRHKKIRIGGKVYGWEVTENCCFNNEQSVQRIRNFLLKNHPFE